MVNREVSGIARDKGVGFSRRSAEFLVDMAVEMELLQPNLSWSAKARVINVLADSLDNLNQYDRIGYLKYFLEADGGTLLHLVKTMAEKGELDHSAFLEGKGWEQIMKDTIQDYLRFDLEPKQRSALKRVSSFVEREEGYGPKTRVHRFDPRVETLVDFGIFSVERRQSKVYRPAVVDGASIAQRFTRMFNDVGALERIIAPEGDFFAAAANLYGLEKKKVDRDRDFEYLASEVVRAYEETRDPDFRLANLATIRDLVCTRLLVDRGLLCEWHDASAAIERLHKENDKSVHFHVDDWGTISYLTMDPPFVRGFAKRVEN